MVIVDSSVWIDMLRGVTNLQTRWLHEALRHEEIGLTSLILCEVLQGVRDPRQFQAFEKDLSIFPVFEMVSHKLAVAAAQNYRALRSEGITVRKTIDCLIATFCIENGFSLLHNDRDFKAFEHHLGLVTIDPQALPLN
jgi:predicted nucleic acid-binding protein